MRVDQVVFRPEPTESPDHPDDERDPEQRAEVRRLDPSMNLDPFEHVVARLAGDGPGDDAYGMPTTNELGPLLERLTLGPAGPRVEVAQDVTDPGKW